MCSAKAPHAEPIPGYRLVEPLGKGGFGEVWKCEAPGGLFKAIKFVTGDTHDDPQGDGARRELQALQRIRSIRHPFLLSIERVEIQGGELVILMELADRSLHDRLVECRTAGRPGVPRPELLGYLREAAEAVDVLNQEHGLQHLDLKPRNLFVLGGHVKVADFGLVVSLGDVQSQTSWLRRGEAVTPLYAAPESFLGRFSLFSDQYSLAVTYQELRTGSLPFTGRNFRQVALRHMQEPPDLQALPEAERPVVARALAKEPRERYPSCAAFVQALAALADVPPPSPPRSHGTRVDIRLGDLAATPSGTREVRVVAPAAATPPAAAGETVPEREDFLAGYRLLECLHRQAPAEVWKAQTGDGRKRLVKLINGFDPADHPDSDPLARLRGLRHPNLPALEIQLGSGGRLALLTDVPDACLGDRLRECQQLGLPGVPRPELLGYLRQAAAALDALYKAHRLQHLGLSPRHLVLRDGQFFLLDFALAELLWVPAGHDPAALNTRYAAPELFERQSSRHGDQYGLALIYQELLTGIHAFRNLNPRQMALARVRGKPDLGLLPAADRPVISQALSVDPDRRFPSCTAFVDALAGDSGETGAASSKHGTKVQVATLSLADLPIEKRRPPSRTGLADVGWERPVADMKRVLAEQVVAAAGDWELRVRGTLRYRFRRAGRGRTSRTGRAVEAVTPALEHRAFGQVLPATMQLKLAGFETEWKARRVEPAKGSAPAAHTAASWLYEVSLGGSFLQRCLGRSPGLRIQIDLSTPRPGGESLTEILLRLTPCDCSADRGAELLESVGPDLLRSLRDHLQLPPDRRADERVAWEENVQVRPVFSERDVGEPFAARTRDLSSGGVGLDLPCRPPCEFLLVQMCPAHRAPLTVPVQALHTRPAGDARHHVGARFAWELVPDPDA